MNKAKQLSIVFSAMLLGIASINAKAETYFGIQAVTLNLEQGGLNDSDTFNAVDSATLIADTVGVEGGIVDVSHLGGLVRWGKQVNPYFSFEGRIGLALGDDSYDEVTNDRPTANLADCSVADACDTSTSETAEVENLYGGFLRWGPRWGIVHPHGILGYTITSISGGNGVSDGESGISFGLGVDVDLGDTITIALEQLNYVDEGDVEVSAFSAGIAWRF